MKLTLSKDNGEILGVYKIVAVHDHDDCPDLEISIRDLKLYGTQDFEFIRRDILIQYPNCK